MKPTDLSNPGYFHKVVDCQWACPAHTPVPHYIRLVAEGRYADAYMANWEANVFPGILGRTCDRPCEPACRRARVDKEPVAICRLKRVAADHKGDISARLPRPATQKNGKRIALVGAGPSSLSLARDLAPLGYHCVLFDADPKAGGMMRTRIPRFRVPEDVIDEEVNQILALGVEFRPGTRVDSLKALLAEGWDAVFVGAGAPRGQDLDLPGRREAGASIHIGVEWLANIWFQHIRSVGKRVVVIGGGNTAMDCSRSARRRGGEDVKVIVRSSLADMKATASEKADAQTEGIGILTDLVPREFTHENGRLTGICCERVRSVHEDGHRRLVPTGEPLQHFPCDEVLIAAGQEPAFTWIERDLGIEFGENGLPKLDILSFRSGHPRVFFGGDAAIGPKNIITAVAHGREAAISIDTFLSGRGPVERPAPTAALGRGKPVTGLPARMPDVSAAPRFLVPRRGAAEAFATVDAEVELGFTVEQAVAEAGRCLNCDVETVFEAPLCVECNSCVSYCPTDCITFTKNGDEAELRTRLRAPADNLAQDLYVADGLVSGRIMTKNEDICLHCGLCAENCPTGAWQMQNFSLHVAHAGALRRATFSKVGTYD
jgi:formate dehydrogenase beta subunit